MNPNVIQFACGHCHTTLTVPAHLAGVTGPCPSCGNTITSPRSTVQEAQPLFSTGSQSMPAPASASASLVQPPSAMQAPAPVSTASLWPGLGAANLPPSAASRPLYPPAPEAPSAAPGLYPPQSAGGTNPLIQRLADPQQPSGPQWNAPRPTEQLGMNAAGAPQPNPSAPTTGPNASRLSLLARQLGDVSTAPQDGQMQTDVSGSAFGADTMMDYPRTGPLGGSLGSPPIAQGSPAVTLPQFSTRKTPSKVGRIGAIAAAMLVGALGYVGWSKRVELHDAYTSWKGGSSDVAVAEPTISVPTEGGETPPSIEEQKPEEPTPTKAVSLPKAEPLAQGEPSAAVADVEPVVKKPESPSVESVNASTPPTPPRAVPVEDDEGSVGGNGPQMVTAAADGSKATPSLVEVGREPEADAGKTTTSSLARSESVVSAVGGPRVVGVPKDAEEGLQGLISFLKATSWEDRLKHTMLPDHVADKGRIYYQSNPDGAIAVDEIHYLRHAPRPEVGKGLHCVFVVFSRGWGEDGFPVMVEVKDGVARVDWLTFVEFKDNMLAQFAANPTIEGRWQFHVMLRRCHYFDDDVPNVDEKDCFEIGPPMPTSSPIYAFTDRVSQLARELSTTITWDKQVTWGIVELEWKRVDGQQWVELTAVPQLNWYSAVQPDVKKAPALTNGQAAK